MLLLTAGAEVVPERYTRNEEGDTEVFLDSLALVNKIVAQLLLLLLPFLVNM